MQVVFVPVAQSVERYKYALKKMVGDRALLSSAHERMLADVLAAAWLPPKTIC